MARPADPTTRIALLAAAEQVFAERGIAGAHVAEIARRAGTSKGSFYLHFQSKDDAFLAVVESFLARCAAMIQPPDRADEAPSDPDGMLEHWLEVDTQVFDFLWQNRSIIRILGGCSGPYAYLLESFHGTLARYTARWIELRKEAGLFRDDVDTAVLSALIRGAYDGLVRSMLLSDERPPVREWLAQAQAVFARGVGTEPVRAAVEGPSSGPTAIGTLASGDAR